METTSISVGELLYELVANFTNVTEYGISMNNLLSGTAAPHPAGVRFDVSFEGTLHGPRLSGTIAGVDYVHVRADGQFQLHIHAQITTKDGENISFFAEGVALPEEGTTVVQLREKITFLTASPGYAWLNQVQGLGVGTADPATGEIKVNVYG